MEPHAHFVACLVFMLKANEIRRQQFRQMKSEATYRVFRRVRARLPPQFYQNRTVGEPHDPVIVVLIVVS